MTLTGGTLANRCGSIEAVLSRAAQWSIQCGDSRKVIASLPDNCLDSIVTDPPYFIRMMGHKWDRPKQQVALDRMFWGSVRRVLKPGGHLCAFGFPRTVHLLTSAIEDGGFEIRDTIPWMFATGMPKGILNVGKRIDESLGLERPVIGTYRVGGNALTPTADKGGNYAVGAPNSPSGVLTRTAPASMEAAIWEDWAGMLKIANEPIVLARKPLDGTLVENVRKWGTGALNIGATRIKRDWLNEPGRGEKWARSAHSKKPGANKIAAPPGVGMQLHPDGSHPPNLLMDDFVAFLLDESAGEWASRFFPSFPGVFSPKASRKERDAGLEHWPVRSAGKATKRKEGSAGLALAGTGSTGNSRNPHVSIKPDKVLNWLLRLTTPPGGVVADMFLGSGSTMCSAVRIGYRCIGIELGEGEENAHLYAAAAYDRVAHWERVGEAEDPNPFRRPDPPPKDDKQLRLI